MSVLIAKCPVHGLHGERAECYVCGGPVEQVPFVSAAVLRRLVAAIAAREGYASDELTASAEWLPEAWAELLEAYEQAKAVLAGSPGPSEPAGVLTLHDGWMHVGCTTCGRVREWPVERAAEPVYCTHSTDALWFGRGAPHSAWTLMVPVLVTEATVEPVA